jgi:hypothetical protein
MVLFINLIHVLFSITPFLAGFAVPVQTDRYTADSGATGGRRYRSGSNILNLNSKNSKMKQKYLKNTSRFIESNSVKIFANLVHLVLFSIITTSAKIEKE